LAPVLSGVRVIDLSWSPAGAITTMCLADQGADVVQIDPSSPKPSPYLLADAWQRGKRTTVLDLHVASDRAELDRLLAVADVVVETWSPSERESLGLDPAAFRRTNDQLIVCSITGYGSHGSWRDRPAHDALVQARTGMQFEQAGHRAGPIFLRVPLPSYGASLLASCAINAALFARALTGQGQSVETSLFQGMQLMTVLAMSRVANPPSGYYAHYECRSVGITPCVECADGRWIHPMPDATTTVLETLGERRDALPGEWRGDCDTVVPYHAALADLYRRLPSEKWLDILQARDHRVQPVGRVDDAFDHEQVRHNGAVVTIEDPVLGALEQVGPPYRLERNEPAVRPRVTDTSPVGDVLAAFRRLPRADRPRPPRRLRHPLEGIVVLDLGLALAGPFAPMLMSDLGAEVIRIDNVVAPRGINDQIWAGCQRGKRSITLDLKSPEGRDVARRLFERADVVHHNMRPGAAERLGLGYEDAKAINPRIVYCHVTGFGVSGPLARAGGCDQMAQALSGLEHDQGATDAGGHPTWLRYGMCDHVGAVASVIGALQALYERERTGEGQLVTANLLDAAMFLQSDAVRRPGTDVVLPRTALDVGQFGLGPLYRLYETRQGWLCIACVGDDEWRALCAAVERPDLLTDPRNATADARIHSDALASELEAVFASRTAQEWFGILDAGGVPCEIASEAFLDDWYDDADVVANAFVARYEHPVWGLTEQMGPLFGFSYTASRVAGPPVVPGQHSVEILQDLGCDSDEIAELIRRKVTVLPDLSAPSR
jgi:crotonobetainyl-CoA:carnitine CoA-transferase CaiB-like acyl-CoA transferase